MTAAVTTYDRPDQVKRAVRSVVAQTYDRLELLVVEDGTDSDVEAWLDAEGIEAEYVRHDSNRGLAAARNTAIEQSTAAYVAFLDDDDAWKPRRVERTVARLQSIPQEALATFGVVHCGTERRSNGRVLSIGHPENQGNLQESIIERGASTLPSSCLFSKTALKAVGGYDESLPSSIDHDIWMALAVGGYDAYTVDEPLVVTFDPFEASMMTDTDARIRGVRQFVEKWLPTYEEWFGERAGRRYAERYFARTIARLAAFKFVSGQYDEARTAISAIRSETDETVYPAFVVAKATLEASVKRFLPPVAIRPLAALASRLSW